MKTRTIVEAPLFAVRKPYDGEDLEIYAADLKSAEVGAKWVTTNQDCYPNRTCDWEESFEVVYKNDLGVAILYHCEEATSCDYHHDEEVELIWVALH